jgi:hypothetical protein
MTKLLDIVREDFKAAKKSFEEKEFDSANVLANRLMGNVLYGTPKHLILIGFVLKELAIDALRFGAEGEPADKLKSARIECISALESAIEEDINLKDVWESYYEYEKEARAVYLTKAEKEAYKEAADFTNAALKHLLEAYLLPEDSLTKDSLMVVKGVLHEATRLARTHWIERKDFLVVGLLSALDRLFDFAVTEASTSREGLDRAALKQRIAPIQASIRQTLEGWETASYDDLLPRISDAVCDLTLDWRRCFVRFLELPRASVAREDRRIPLPDEAKKKLGKTLAEALEKDLHPPKKKK